ncbi:glycosyltransferase family 4 protein [Spirulina sp. CS-785/01]|uniref:glycosyltransferase family 4 protein n=1 Tax=Spirulina sp. CS-785/01 TaxID=3021716 RepID=UPI002330AF64|nr:glycosyltransferase family 4 protein [Spirulina sp. CS-785/01]MDB9313246.1 glycosyltransferase family 4 protein [Spirulina sp. CS-785/01]
MKNNITYNSTTPSIGLIHPTGNPFARNAALALAEMGYLKEIITCLAYNPQTKIAQTLQTFLPPLHQELTRRTWVAPDGVTLHTYPTPELLRIAALRLGVHRLLHRNPQHLADWVYRVIDQKVASSHLTPLTAVYAYEDGAATTFTQAQQQGIVCFYDLPIVHYQQSQQLQTQEAEQFPELTPALLSVQEPPEKLRRKDQEIALADHIIVPSTVVQQSLLQVGVSADKITVIPFGSPHDYFHPQPKPDTTFRALFVGRVGPRKGVHYLLQAWQPLQLPNAELLLVGFNEFPEGWLSPYEGSFRYLPSVPHSLLNPYYSSASVFVFPSLVEGLALVLLEAMACGLPVITTPNAGGTDIITDGVEGFIIPIRDVEALQDKLLWCHQHPQELAEMGQAARQRAEQLTWGLYRQRLKRTVEEILVAERA